MVWDVFLLPDGGVIRLVFDCTIITTGVISRLFLEDWYLPMKTDTEKQLLRMRRPGSILVRVHTAMQDSLTGRLMMRVWKNFIMNFQNRISRQMA